VRKVTIIPASPALGPGAGLGQEIVLFDETKSPLPDACADGFIPKATRLIRPVSEIRAAYRPVFDRANVLVKWNFTVLHTFASVDQCQDFVGQRPDTLPGAGELYIYLTTSTGLFLRAYKTCFIDSHGPAADLGLSVRYRYSLTLNSDYSLTP
jgi:hypothetical protein